MHRVTVIYNRRMKMSDLVDTDYRLLLLLNKLNIPLGFGEKSVDTVCQENNFDTDCFLFLANYQTNGINGETKQIFETLPLEPFLTYLKKSHSYFLGKRLPNIRRKLKIVFSLTEQNLLNIVLDFFDVYTKEVTEHMHYEDMVAFPYIHKLLNTESVDTYSISVFEGRHNDIEGKMNDLKQILMKYVPGSVDQILMTNILMELYMSEEELEAHTFIEDNLVIPRVKALEKTRRGK